MRNGYMRRSLCNSGEDRWAWLEGRQRCYKGYRCIAAAVCVGGVGSTSKWRRMLEVGQDTVDYV